MNFIKARLFKFAIPLALLGMVGCAKNELELEPSIAQQQNAERTIEVDLHIEAMAAMPEASNEARATGGALQLYFKDGKPLFRVEDTTPYSSDGTMKAHCVFMPLKQGSTTELDNTRALYGDVYFKRKGNSQPSIVEKQAVAVELVSDGKVTLKGSTNINKGEQWYVMGLVGGKADDTGRNIEVKGFNVAIEDDEGVSSGIDVTQELGGASAPFLSRWTKLAPAKDVNVVTSFNPINFRFQGILFTADIRNETEYNLRALLLQLQSTELTQHVSYDLMSSTNVNDTEADVTWVNKGSQASENRWFVSPMTLFLKDKQNGQVLYEYNFDSKSSNGGGYMYNAKKPTKDKVTVVFWANAIDKPVIKINNANGEVIEKPLPYRTGFFLSVDNREAKPIGVTSDNGYKYVYSTDPALDEIVGSTATSYANPKQKGMYDPNIAIAPPMDFVCVRTVQKSLKSNQGKYVHLTLKVPVRPVMPIETMAQSNLWSHEKGAKEMSFIKPDGANSGTQINAVNYAQAASYALELAKYTSSYWMLPSKEQLYGVILPGNNAHNTHNWNHTATPSGVYNWVEKGPAVKEKITFSDGTTQDYYMMYGRPAKGTNDNKVYGLRFFTDDTNLKGSEHFSLTKYEFTTSAGKRQIFRVSTAWLGPEYAKLYEGMFEDQRDWIKEIATNDNDNQDNLFRKFQNDFVTRDFIAEAPRNGTYYSSIPQGGAYTTVMVGYFYGTSSAVNRAVAFNNKRVITGVAEGTDFTNFTGARGYLRPMRRNFTKFVYR